MKPTNLDDPLTYKQLDPQNMLQHIQDVPDLCHQAWTQAQSIRLPSKYSHINNIAILGMGGSAIGGDLLSGLVPGELPVPINVHRGYTLPAYVNQNTLVIASSYSGSTEETLSAFQQAIEVKASILVMTTGGRMKTIADEHGLPVFIFNYQSPPRAALYLSFIALLGIMQKLGFIADKNAAVMQSVKLLEELEHKLNPEVPSVSNTAKQIARAMSGKMVVIYGAEFLSEVAHRWKAQINENAKSWAFYGAIPEINHNDVTGYQFPKEISHNTLAIILNSPLLNERIKQRYQITAELLKQSGIEHSEVTATAPAALSEMLELMLLGDFASYYLSLLNRTDPYPIKAVDFLKAELTKKP
jgi:glucose/mannose-6-phosphate isomerase